MASAAGDDPAAPQSGSDPAEGPEDAWAQIVAHLDDIDLPVDEVVEHRPVDDIPAAAPDPDAGLTGRDWAGTDRIAAAEAAVDEAEHFVPPEPPPVFGGDRLLTAAWLAVVAMPTLWLVVLLGWRSAPTWLLQASAGAFAAGLLLLFWRLPHRRDPDDEDDGARV